jgi:hypothetical protein
MALFLSETAITEGAFFPLILFGVLLPLAIQNIKQQ